MSGIRGSCGTMGVVWAILGILRDEWYKGILWILLEVADADEYAPVEDVKREEDDWKRHPARDKTCTCFNGY